MTLEHLFARRDRRKSCHLGRVIRRRLLVVGELPRVALPLGRPEPVPETLAAPFLEGHVRRELGIQEILPGAPKVALRPTAVGTCILWTRSSESVETFVRMWELTFKFLRSYDQVLVRGIEGGHGAENEFGCSEKKNQNIYTFL